MHTGRNSTCGQRVDGTLWCWGSNMYGQLGDGTTTPSWVPAQVGSATNWDQISVYDHHVCGTRDDGTLWCWGYNHYGQLGNGMLFPTANPDVQQVGTDTDWSRVTVGMSHTCALRTDDTRWCWGSSGSLGIPRVPQLVVFP